MTMLDRKEANNKPWESAKVWYVPERENVLSYVARWTSQGQNDDFPCTRTPNLFFGAN
jgi:hypothetical protein